MNKVKKYHDRKKGKAAHRAALQRRELERVRVKNVWYPDPPKPSPFYPSIRISDESHAIIPALALASLSRSLRSLRHTGRTYVGR